MMAYDKVAQPILAAIDGLDRERQHLESLRDTILPKLVSGEIRVPDTKDHEEVIGPVADELTAAKP
jgi:type I restriction enzyme S subunit